MWQIGSYFGSVLQTLDVDQDSYTDLLLVGAPMFMGSERDEQGQVYVYKLNTVLRQRESEVKFSERCYFLKQGGISFQTFYFVADI